MRFGGMAGEIAALAVQHASRDDIAKAAAENGMRSMWDDGLEKVASGLTSIEELARILSCPTTPIRRIDRVRG